MPATQSPAFAKAAEESKKLTKKPCDDDLLSLYSLYKVGCGEDIASAEYPSVFDLKGKAKRTAWQKVVDEEDITAEKAQERYVTLVEKLKTSCGFDANKMPLAIGS